MPSPSFNGKQTTIVDAVTSSNVLLKFWRYRKPNAIKWALWSPILRVRIRLKQTHLRKHRSRTPSSERTVEQRTWWASWLIRSSNGEITRWIHETKRRSDFDTVLFLARTQQMVKNCENQSNELISKTPPHCCTNRDWLCGCRPPVVLRALLLINTVAICSFSERL